MLCLATFPLLSALAIHSHNLVLESPPHFPLRSRPLRASVRDDLFLDLMRRCTFFTTSGFSDWPAQTYDFFEVLREKKGVGLPLREWMKFLYDARQASHHSSLEAGIVTRGIAEAWWLGPGAAERKSGERIQIQELDDFVGGLRVGHVGEDDDNCAFSIFIARMDGLMDGRCATCWLLRRCLQETDSADPFHRQGQEGTIRRKRNGQRTARFAVGYPTYGAWPFRRKHQGSTNTRRWREGVAVRRRKSWRWR